MTPRHGESLQFGLLPIDGAIVSVWDSAVFVTRHSDFMYLIPLSLIADLRTEKST